MGRATSQRKQSTAKGRGQPKKEPVPETSSGKRAKTGESEYESDEPNFKKQKISIDHNFGMLLSGVALTLGQGEFGQLGLGDNIVSRKKPALVGFDLAGKKIKKVVAGGMHTVCLTEDHKVYTFGCNDEGALGRTTSEDTEEFEPGLVGEVLSEKKIVDITAGDSHSAALTDEGEVFLWGCFRDNHGKLGLLKESEGCRTPVQLTNMRSPIERISSGLDHLAMINSEGKLLTIGCGEQGQLGRISRYFIDRGGRRKAGPYLTRSQTSKLQRGDLAEDYCLRQKAINVPKAKGRRTKPHLREVFCGSYYTYAMSDEGDVFVFGLNNYKQLGVGEDDCLYMPVHSPALSGTKWKMIAGGLHHSLLLDDKGNVYSIGRGDYGRLGLGEDVELAEKPTQIEGLKDIVHVAAGGCVSFAVDKHGKAYGWGMGTNLQLTTGQFKLVPPLLSTGGQLTILGTEDDEWTPIELTGKNLEERSVLTVEAGGQHTVILARPKSEMVNGEST